MLDDLRNSAASSYEESIPPEVEARRIKKMRKKEPFLGMTSAQRFVVVASPAYLAAHGAPRTPHELPGHACVRLRFPSGAIYRWDFARDGEALEVEVNGPITVGERARRPS